MTKHVWLQFAFIKENKDPKGQRIHDLERTDICCVHIWAHMFNKVENMYITEMRRRKKIMQKISQHFATHAIFWTSESPSEKGL